MRSGRLFLGRRHRFWSRRYRLRTEIHFGRRRDCFFVFNRKLGLDRVAEHHRRQVRRELPRQDVVGLNGIREALSGDRDAVLSPLQLRLQFAEIRIGFELRIGFSHHQQARQRAG